MCLYKSSTHCCSLESRIRSSPTLAKLPTGARNVFARRTDDDVVLVAMSYYYDSDDDDVVLVQQGAGTRSARAKDGRYSSWSQSELEKQMFSWSLKDVLNKDLLKKKVTKQ